MNISLNKKQETSLKVNKIRFDEESINVNNRLIIKQNIGISRYDDELDGDVPHSIQLTGARSFQITHVQVLNIINNPF